MIKFYKIIVIIVSFLIFGAVNFLSFIIPLFLMFDSELNRDGVEYIPFMTLLIIMLVLYLCKYISSYMFACLLTKLELFKFLKEFIIEQKLYTLILKVFFVIDCLLFIYFLSDGWICAIILMIISSFSLLYLPFYFAIKNSKF